MKTLQLVTMLYMVLQVGCAAKKFRGPDGRMYFEAKCYDSIVECYRKADNNCEQGYTSYQELVSQVPDDRDRWNRAGDALSSKPSVTVNVGPNTRTQHTLLYDCK